MDYKTAVKIDYPDAELNKDINQFRITVCFDKDLHDIGFGQTELEAWKEAYVFINNLG